MKLVFFTHPSFLNSQSMPRYANMLATAMKERGYSTEVWAPEAFFFNWKLPSAAKKWMGYIDQYILFPSKIKKKIRSAQADTLFVLTDQALGPWVPLVKDHAHIIHCHDFLAQRSALGLVPENATGLSGRIYQSYIRKGYQQGKNFISVSKKTEADLLSFLIDKPALSAVVYNSLNQQFILLDTAVARKTLEQKTGIDLSKGYILHVGGNQWYKNRPGVIEIYNAFQTNTSVKIPLLLIGQKPSAALEAAYQASPFKTQIFLLTGLDDETVRQAYAGAAVFLFPSLAEGFGWPIAEAMASGCPVITTDEAPMTEVAGGCAFLIPRRPADPAKIPAWAGDAAATITKVLNLHPHQRQQCIHEGLVNVQRFAPATVNNQIEALYKTAYLNHFNSETVKRNS